MVRRIAQHLKFIIIIRFENKHIQIYIKYTYIQMDAESGIQNLIITSEIQGLNITQLQEYKLGLMEFHTRLSPT